MASPEGGWPSYHAARLAYGAADALVQADAYARNPVLAHLAPAIRRNAIAALVEAIAELELMQ